MGEAKGGRRGKEGKWCELAEVSWSCANARRQFRSDSAEIWTTTHFGRAKYAAFFTPGCSLHHKSACSSRSTTHAASLIARRTNRRSSTLPAQQTGHPSALQISRPLTLAVKDTSR